MRHRKPDTNVHSASRVEEGCAIFLLTCILKHIYTYSLILMFPKNQILSDHKVISLVILFHKTVHKQFCAV